MRAVVYARVSSSMQRERDTIASQMRVVPEYIERQGWTLARPARTYVDDGHTAKSGHLAARLGLTALLRDAAAGAFDVVCVVDIDRLTRSEDLVERGAILGAFQRARVKIASASSGQVLDLSTSLGDLFSTLQTFFAAEDNRKRITRITAGKITAIQRGRKPSGPTPFGLAYAKATGVWSIDEARAAIVREVLARLVGGESCEEIAADFDARGVPRERSSVWIRERVWKIATNTHYTGTWTADRARRLSVAVPPIVEAALWHRAQEHLKISRRRGLRRTKHVYLLEGIAVCSCGAPIRIRSASISKKPGMMNPAAYICRNRKRSRRHGPRCPNKCAPVKITDERVWAAIRGEIDGPDLIASLLEQERLHRSDARDWTTDATEYRAGLARLERTEIAVLARFRRGLIGEGALDIELAALRRERDAITAQLATVERAGRTTSAATERVGDAAAMIRDLRGAMAASTPEERRTIVLALVPPGGIELDGRSLIVTLLVPRTDAARGRSEIALVTDSSTNLRRESHLRIRMVA